MTPHPTLRVRRPTRKVALTVVTPLVVTALSVTGLALSPAAASTGAASANPVSPRPGQVQNVTFDYDAGTPLAPGADLSALGHPAVVVSTRRADEPAAVAAIHSVGAKAYRYVQFYWAPGDSEYEGMDLQKHPDWAFCGADGRRSVGRVTDGGTRSWYFLDTNETAVRAQIRSVLAGLRAQGWDGVMFDRGEAATQYAADKAGHAVWSQRSTCTAAPASAGATFADSYVHLLSLAHGAGLSTMLNTGKSAFDTVAPLRPDPRDADCRAHRWSRCRHLSDAWSSLDVVVNETATAPRDRSWRRYFVSNSRAERSRTHGHRTVALVTTAALGGERHQTRANVYYAWSRIKLFNIAAAANTGEGGCGAGDTGICNQHGFYPELVDTVYGRPLASRPTAQDCAKRSKVHCVWVRRYSQGVNVVNVRPSARNRTRVVLGTASCRYVFDVYHHAPLANNACVKAVRLALPAWSGRPLKLATRPW